MGLKLIINSLIFISAIASGIWLSKLGQPYKPLAFNIHKLLSVAFIIYSFILIKNIIKSVPGTNLLWILIGLCAVFAVILIITGGILSVNQNAKTYILILHKITRSLILISLSSWFYLSLK